MAECKKCGKEFEPQKGLISFCSLQCRNARIWNEEDRLKKAISIQKKIAFAKGVEYIFKPKKVRKGRKYIKRQLAIKVCKECGKEYIKNNKDYCSNICRTKTSGGLKIGGGRGKCCWYESNIAGKVYLRSTYELEYAKWLDKNNINWVSNKKSFEYEFEGKIKKYYPDFYLINEDYYIEIKNFKTLKDEAKWKNFANLKVLYYKDLKQLGLNVKK